MPELSLIIPAYNESKNIPLLLDRASQVLNVPGVELIIVDNGSTDQSQEVLRELLPKFPFVRSVRVEKNQGYGFGILSGLRAAQGKYLGWTHADLQTDPGDALRGLEILRSPANQGKVFVKGKRHGRPIADVFFTSGMGVFETILMGTPMWDINAQPTMFPRSFFEKWVNPPHDFSLDLYSFYMAQRFGYLIERFPVNFGKRSHGVSHWNVNWQAKIKFIQRTVDYSLRMRGDLRKLDELNKPSSKPD